MIIYESIIKYGINSSLIIYFYKYILVFSSHIELNIFEKIIIFFYKNKK